MNSTEGVRDDGFERRISMMKRLTFDGVPECRHGLGYFDQ